MSVVDKLVKLPKVVGISVGGSVVTGKRLEVMKERIVGTNWVVVVEMIAVVSISSRALGT